MRQVATITNYNGEHMNGRASLNELATLLSAYTQDDQNMSLAVGRVNKVKKSLKNLSERAEFVLEKISPENIGGLIFIGSVTFISVFIHHLVGETGIPTPTSDQEKLERQILNDMRHRSGRLPIGMEEPAANAMIVMFFIYALIKCTQKMSGRMSEISNPDNPLVAYLLSHLLSSDQHQQLLTQVSGESVTIAEEIYSYIR